MPKKPFDTMEYVDGMFDDIPQEMFTPGSRVFMPPETIVGDAHALDNPNSRIFFPPETITGHVKPETIDPRQVIQPGVYDSTGVADAISPFQVKQPGFADNIRPSQVMPGGIADNIPMSASRRTAPPLPQMDARAYARNTVNDMFSGLPADLGGPSLDNVAFNIDEDVPPPEEPIKDRLFPPSGPPRLTGQAVAGGRKPKR